MSDVMNDRQLSTKLKLALTASEVGLWEWNLKTDEFFWDKRMFDIYGFSENQFVLTYEVWVSRLHQDDKSKVEALLRFAIENETDFKCEFRIIRPDKSIRYIQSSGRIYKNTKDENILIIANLDFTERKTAEDRFRTVIESAPNSIVMVATDGKISLVNKQTEDLFGYKRDELIGKEIEILVPAKFRSDHIEQRKQFFRKPTTRVMGSGRDLFGCHKNGFEFPIEIGLNPIIINEETFVLASIINISERKKIEQALKNKNIELEKTNRELDEFA